MKFVKTDELKEGMRLAKPIYNKNVDASFFGCFVFTDRIDWKEIGIFGYNIAHDD